MKKQRKTEEKQIQLIEALNHKTFTLNQNERRVIIGFPKGKYTNKHDSVKILAAKLAKSLTQLEYLGYGYAHRQK